MQEKRMHENRVSLPTIATLCNSSTEVVALLGTMLFSTRHAPKFSRLTLLKTWRGNFLVLARKAKNSHATTKKISFHFFREFEPKSVHFWFGSMSQ